MAEATHISNSSKAKFKMKSISSTAVSKISRLGTFTLIAIAGLAATATNPALAHGDKAMKASPVVKEQKPWGIAGDLKGVKRTVTLTMDDKMRFTPDTLSFKEGETVRFIVKNQGKLLQEMVIGTRAELDAHAALMENFRTWRTMSLIWRMWTRASKAVWSGPSTAPVISNCLPGGRPLCGRHEGPYQSVSALSLLEFSKFIF